MKWLMVILLLAIPTQQEYEGWELFQKVKYTPTYFEEANAYFEVPTFNQELLAIEGEEVSLTGYIIPMDSESVFMLSALPFASCFFCGGAGPETVAEIVLESPSTTLILDDYVTVKGKLELNGDDIDHLSFILKESVINPKN